MKLKGIDFALPGNSVRYISRNFLFYKTEKIRKISIIAKFILLIIGLIANILSSALLVK